MLNFLPGNDQKSIYLDKADHPLVGHLPVPCLYDLLLHGHGAGHLGISRCGRNAAAGVTDQRGNESERVWREVDYRDVQHIRI